MNIKDEIRQNIRTEKLRQSESGSVNASNEICRLLENCTIFKESSNILLYHSLPDEVATLDFIKKWRDKKNIFLPRVNGTSLDILAYDETALSKGAYNISEPVGNELQDLNDIDLIIVPAMALDKKGNRLGRGKGYYDKLLCRCNAYKIGIVYSYQLLETIPSEIHDIPMDMIITERGVITPNT